MKSVTRLIFNWFRSKICIKTVASRNCAHNSLKCCKIVCRTNRSIALKVNFMLTRPCFMMTYFRLNSHLFKRNTNVAANIFSAVCRSKFTISAVIMWNICRISLFICLEKIEFTFCSNFYFVAFFVCFKALFLKNISCITFKWSSVRIANITVKTNYTPMLRSPWQHRKSRRIRHKEQITSVHS